GTGSPDAAGGPAERRSLNAPAPCLPLSVIPVLARLHEARISPLQWRTPPIGVMSMTHLTTSIFDLPRDLAAKADPALVAADDAHFEAIAAHLDHTTSDLTERLAVERKAPGGGGQEAMDRDLQIHRLTARLNLLRRFSLEVCLGRFVTEHGETIYIGRIGLSDRDGNPLLIDWRSPAAAPCFGATHAQPMGLVSRRRYRWTAGRITDYWDEAFTTEGLEHGTALDDQSAFIASLGSSRTER